MMSSAQREAKVRWEKIKSNPELRSAHNARMREYNKSYRKLGHVKAKASKSSRIGWEKTKSDQTKLLHFRERGNRSHKARNFAEKRRKIELLKIALCNPEFVSSFREAVAQSNADIPMVVTRFGAVRKKVVIKDSDRVRRKQCATRMREEIRKDPVRLAKFREEARIRAQKWRERDGGKRQKMLFERDPGYKLVCRLKGRIRVAMKDGGARSRSKYQYLFGCTFEELTKHIQGKWENGMGWENYGRGAGKWNIDHVRPLSSFDLLDEEQRKVAFHYKNVQPKWALENIQKNSNWNGRRWTYADHAKENIFKYA